MREWEPQVDDDDRRRKSRQHRPSGVIRFLWGVIAVLVIVGAGLGIAFFSGAISIAQQPPQQNAAAVPTPTPRPTTGAQPPAVGQQATAPPQATVTKTATYGDWIYTCVKLPNSEEIRCGIAQQLSDAKSKTPVFLWRIAQDGKGGLVGEWQTRTGIMVNRGIVLDAGTDKPITIPFQLCTPQGCQAVANLAADFIDALTKAQKATATVFPIGGNGVQLTLSVKGLPEALAALKQ